MFKQTYSILDVSADQKYVIFIPWSVEQNDEVDYFFACCYNFAEIKS